MINVIDFILILSDLYIAVQSVKVPKGVSLLQLYYTWDSVSSFATF